MGDAKPGPRFSVEKLSADGQRVSREVGFVQLPSPVKKRCIADETRQAQEHFSNVGLDLEEALPFAGIYTRWDEDREVNVDEDNKAKRYISSDEPLKAWLPFCDEYLREMVALEASEWSGMPLCRECCVYEHSQMPLHVVKKWNGTFFEKVSLQSLGLRVQLGHAGNAQCLSRKEKPIKFTVVHTNGIHSVSVDYCQCHGGASAGQEYQELLRNEWFPATHLEPQTAATFRCIEQFHILTLTGKVTPFDYYTGIQRLTDNTGCKKVSWLKMIHRSGIESFCGWVANIVICGLVNAQTPESRFIYTLFLAMDACFRLKRKMVSSDEKNPGLGTGMAYFVEDQPYREYCQTLGNQNEMNTCTGLSTVDHVNTRFSRGYAVTGVGLGLCARHELVAKNAVGDIQKGEKFGNMAFIFASLLRHVLEIISIVLSYDINCQFSKNFISCVAALPPLLFRWAIPKLHILGHKQDCQREFNLNYMLGVGRTDGEGVERPWANIGPVATSTREMGPGHRHNMLDDHWHDWNWRKIVALGKLLARRHLEVKSELLVQEEAYGNFSNNQLAQVPEWRDRVESWEADPKAPNPYKQLGSTITLQEVRLRLAEEESMLASTGLGRIHDVSLAEFLIMGLEAEEQQHCLKQEVERLKSGGTMKQTADVIEKRNKLTHQISRFRPLQAMYMPATVQILTDMGKVLGKDGLPLPAPAAEDVRLLFPSDLMPEQRLRGLASDIQKRSCETPGIDNEVSGMLERNESKITLSARRYRGAWEAKWKLVNKDMEKVGWRKLEVKDIQCMQDLTEMAKEQKKREKKKGKKRKLDDTCLDGDDLETAAASAGLPSGVSEGKKVLSWIWSDSTASGMLDSESLQDVRRWREEERLLSEEMRRVLVSLEWKARWWERRAVMIGFEPRRAAGAAALAARQAAVCHAIASRFRDLWKEWDEEDNRMSAEAGGGVETTDNFDCSQWPEELEGEVEEQDMLRMRCRDGEHLRVFESFCKRVGKAQVADTGGDSSEFSEPSEYSSDSSSGHSHDDKRREKRKEKRRRRNEKEKKLKKEWKQMGSGGSDGSGDESGSDGSSTDSTSSSSSSTLSRRRERN
ncbi:hypothetical protein C8J56DRAFT_897711 [Mycena floridula]|nr:hypothetical protein C8J56DRAFT_897711 [Mycena floridula]